jgi:hypothetical protein
MSFFFRHVCECGKVHVYNANAANATSTANVPAPETAPRVEPPLPKPAKKRAANKAATAAVAAAAAPLGAKKPRTIGNIAIVEKDGRAEAHITSVSI